MVNVHGSGRKLQIQVKRFAGQHNTREREPDQHQNQRDKQYQKSHSELVFMNGRRLLTTSPRNKTAGLPATLSFTIDNLNGFKELNIIT